MKLIKNRAYTNYRSCWKCSVFYTHTRTFIFLAFQEQLYFRAVKYVGEGDRVNLKILSFKSWSPVIVSTFCV
jgi:hypothetical protein